MPRARDRCRTWRWGDPIPPLRELVARGGVLAIPTESSYGLAADPRSARGVERIGRIKGREGAKPLPVVAASLAQIADLGIDAAEPRLLRLAAAWPAALTVVAPLRTPLPAAAGSGALGVRIPAHLGLRALLEALGIALTATSANRAGEEPLLEPGAVAELLAGEDAAVIDAGALPGGPPSTVVRLIPGLVHGGLEIVRPGSYPLDALERLAPELTARVGRGPGDPDR